MKLRRLLIINGAIFFGYLFIFVINYLFSFFSYFISLLLLFFISLICIPTIIFLLLNKSYFRIATIIIPVVIFFALLAYFGRLCPDGGGTNYYYDFREYNESQSMTSHSYGKLIASISYGSCDKYMNYYSILIGNGLMSVPKYKFEKYIKEYSACGNCILIYHSGMRRGLYFYDANSSAARARICETDIYNYSCIKEYFNNLSTK